MKSKSMLSVKSEFLCSKSAILLVVIESSCSFVSDTESSSILKLKGILAAPFAVFKISLAIDIEFNVKFAEEVFFGKK